MRAITCTVRWGRLVLLSLLFPVLAFAGDAVPDTLTHADDEMVVHASRYGENAHLSYTNISAEELETRIGVTDIPMLLEDTPGLHAYSDAGNGIGYTDETSEPIRSTWVLTDVSPPVPPEGAATLDVPAATFLPTGNNTFPITVTTRGGSETRIRILDLEGRVVTTLVESRFGDFVSPEVDRPTVLQWDGRDSEFERVKAGAYVIHLVSVDPNTGDQVVKTAPVVVATRLNR